MEAKEVMDWIGIMVFIAVGTLICFAVRSTC